MMSGPTLDAAALVEQLRDVLTRLREMEHYSENNIELLGADWMMLAEQPGQTTAAVHVDALLALQSAFHDRLQAALEALQIDVNRREQTG